MKIAIVSDSHFGCRNDSSAFDAYIGRFYKEVFFPYLDKEQIKTVFHCGDVFDRRKYVNFQILKSCRGYFFDPLRQRGIDMYVIPGNHDTYYKNTNEVNSIDLLLSEYENIKTFHSPTDLTLGNTMFRFIPWLCPQNYDVCTTALSGPPNSGPNYAQDVVLIGHFEIQGFDMFRGIRNDGGLDRKVFEKYPIVLSGHFHHRSANDNIHYLGSPYEFIWSDYNDPRGFHIFDTETLDLTFIVNPNKMFHKIYYDDRKEMSFDAEIYTKGCVKVIVTHKDDFKKFDRMIDALSQVDVQELTIHEDFTDFESEIAGDEITRVEDTKTLLSDFVDQTETDVDKERLKALLNTLYVEAQNLDQ